MFVLRSKAQVSSCPMPHRSTPVEQTWPAQAAHKRKAAEKRERQAALMRSEAADLDARWADYVAKRDSKSSAEEPTS
jgi:hypothetical protein